MILSMMAPYLTSVLERMARQSDVDLLVVYETPMERDRKWKPAENLPYEHVVLDSRSVDLSWLAFGAGVKTRFDTYLHIPKHPVRPLLHFRPDAVVAAGGGIWSSPANIAALWTRRRTGWAVVPWWGSFQRPRPTVPRRIAEPWVRAFMRSADAWAAYGRRSERDLVRLGADPARIVIAPIVPHFPPGAVVAPPGGDRRGDSLRLLYVGRLIERKGIDVLLSAFAELANGELWIAGDGPLRAKVEQQASVDRRIHFYGHLEEKAVHRLYREVDAVVVPSWYEPWGLVVHEAMAHGLPVIATDQVGAVDDLMTPGVNGLIVTAGAPHQLAEAMRQLITWEPVDWQRNAECSQERLVGWTPQGAAEGLIRACRLGIRHRARQGLGPR